MYKVYIMKVKASSARHATLEIKITIVNCLGIVTGRGRNAALVKPAGLSHEEGKLKECQV